jgi:hypothetical protein
MNSEVTPTPATSFVLPIDLFYFKMFSPLNAVSLRLPLPVLRSRHIDLY